jgi:hypothetical protein
MACRYMAFPGAAVECLFTWSWLTDLCAAQGIPFVLGHALSLKAIHGGKAKHDKSDAPKIAMVRRGGRLPQASVYPVERRATRDLLRRRTHRMRKRADLLAHVPNTNRQYNRPAIGKTIASKANHTGVAERFDDAAVQKTIEVALALITSDDALLKDLALSLLTTAKPPDAHTLYLWPTVPGLGTILSLILRYDIHDIRRFPSVPDCAFYAPWGNAARGPQAHALEPPAARWGRRTSRGPFPNPPACSSATRSPGKSFWREWKKSMTRSKPGASWRINLAERSTLE